MDSILQPTAPKQHSERRAAPRSGYSLVPFLEGAKNWDSESNVLELKKEAAAGLKSKVDFAGWDQILMTCLYY